MQAFLNVVVNSCVLKIINAYLVMSDKRLCGYVCGDECICGYDAGQSCALGGIFMFSQCMRSSCSEMSDVNKGSLSWDYSPVALLQAVFLSLKSFYCTSPE